MFKLFVLVVLVAAVFGAPAPGFIEHYPAAVSHVSRVDIHDSKPVVAAYAGAPVHYAAAPVHYAAAPVHYAAAPVHYAAAPIASHGYATGHGYGYGYPVAQSYSNRIDVHHAPVVTGTLGHGVYGGYNHLHNDLGYGLHNYGYGHGLDGVHHVL